MNVSKDYPHSFRPFNLVIEVTSKEEEYALKQLFGLNRSVPFTVARESGIGDEGRAILHRLFDRTYKILHA